MFSLLGNDPNLRPSILEIIEHDWLKNTPKPSADEVRQEMINRLKEMEPEHTPSIQTQISKHNIKQKSHRSIENEDTQLKPLAYRDLSSKCFKTKLDPNVAFDFLVTNLRDRMQIEPKISKKSMKLTLTGVMKIQFVFDEAE